ncbi:MAG TPA: universal stress protein [Bryobacteraceae bacterium]|nr:universal stress protein [Bryobacteraceae bacterium]
MFPPKKILFPVDFSDRCASAAPMAEIFAGRFQAELTLLHVVEPLAYNDIPVDSNGIAEERLGSFLVDDLKHFDVRRVLMEGAAAAKIIEYAHSQSADLIMMPTHGYGPFRRLILGSVTAKVLHDAECPVWTGAHMEQVPRLEDISLKRIVCALDLEAQSCPTASWAKKLAAEFGAELAIVHAVPDAKQTTVHDEVRQDLISEATQRVQAVQACVGSEARVFVIADDVAAAVCGCAVEEKADLLVIGRSVKTSVLGRLRANAYSIIRQAPCPVVSV